ncbi:MAG TPA: maltotransferase domain-containing protein, partial [Myxococcaceae bacterium]|nr:maltotransferase domain-containing protein [Myxococcaceae bacterium]
MAERIGSVVIEDVQPSVDGGRHAVKRDVGDEVLVSADVFKEGHDVLVAVARWRQVSPAGAGTEWHESPMRAAGNDRYEGTFPVHVNGRYAFTVEAWPDLFATWTEELQRKLEVGRDVASELLEGAVLLEETAARAPASSADSLRFREVAALLKKGNTPQAIAAALDPGLRAAASRHPDRSLASRADGEREIWVDRVRARFSAWYEFFPRSTDPSGKHGTFITAIDALPRIRDLGFDTIYLPPIHPVGRTFRKGKNNTLTPEPDDVGSPWAIGNEHGGHDAIEPALGTIHDFDLFVEAARRRNMEVALDYALQCSPDHPWAKQHPDWFHQRPDGTIAYAENPPKKYQDIYPFHFESEEWKDLWNELREVFRFWVARGVRIFRVDNPHT